MKSPTFKQLQSSPVLLCTSPRKCSWIGLVLFVHVNVSLLSVRARKFWHRCVLQPFLKMVRLWLSELSGSSSFNSQAPLDQELFNLLAFPSFTWDFFSLLCSRGVQMDHGTMDGGERLMAPCSLEGREKCILECSLCMFGRHSSDTTVMGLSKNPARLILTIPLLPILFLFVLRL